MKEIDRACVTAPAHIGDVLIENVAGCGVNVIATREVQKV
jgi:CxxC motif-containing protein